MRPWAESNGAQSADVAEEAAHVASSSAIASTDSSVGCFDDENAFDVAGSLYDNEPRLESHKSASEPHAEAEPPELDLLENGSRAHCDLLDTNSDLQDDIDGNVLPVDDPEDLGPHSTVEEIAMVRDYIEHLKAASIDNGDLEPDVVTDLHEPRSYVSRLDPHTDWGLLLSLQQYQIHSGGSKRL